MTDKPRPGKRIYLVNRDFQWRYVRIALAVGATSTVLTFVVILYPLFYLNILRWPNFVPGPFLAGMAAAALINFAIVGWMGVLVTHRIAGPMFALVRHLRVIQSGRIPQPLRLRETDELKYVARNFNEAVEAMAAGARRELVLADGLVHALERVEGSADLEQPVGEAASLARSLRSEIQTRLENSAGGDEQAANRQVDR